MHCSRGKMCGRLIVDCDWVSEWTQWIKIGASVEGKNICTKWNRKSLKKLMEPFYSKMFRFYLRKNYVEVFFYTEGIHPQLNVKLGFLLAPCWSDGSYFHSWVFPQEKNSLERTMKDENVTWMVQLKPKIGHDGSLNFFMMVRPLCP